MVCKGGHRSASSQCIATFLLHPSQNHKTHDEALASSSAALVGGYARRGQGSAALPRDDQLGWGRKAVDERTKWTRAAARFSPSPRRGGRRAEGSGRLCGEAKPSNQTGVNQVRARAPEKGTGKARRSLLLSTALTTASPQAPCAHTN